MQPWQVYGVEGKATPRLLSAVAQAMELQPRGEPPEYMFFPDGLEPYTARRLKCAEDMFATLGLAAEEKRARINHVKRNYLLFGRPFQCQPSGGPGMLERGSGVIINITSVGGVSALPAAGGYGPSKAGLSNLTKTMVLQFASRGVRVNAVAPGMMNAGIGARSVADPKLRALREAMSPLGKLGIGAQVADAVLFLASDQAAYITGQELCIDGGLTLTAITGSLPGKP